MAKNGSKKRDKEEYLREYSGLKIQTKHGIMAIVFFVLALFFLMSAFGMSGVAGKFIYEKLYFLLGVGYILLPALLVLLGSSFLKSETPDIGWTRVISATMFLLSGLGMIDIASGKHSGGLLGEILSTPLVSLFDAYASIIFLGAILMISILIIFDAKLELAPFFKKVWAFLRKPLGKKPVAENKNLEEDPASAQDSGEAKEEEDETEEKGTSGNKIKKALGLEKKNKKLENDSEEIEFKKLEPRTSHL